MSERAAVLREIGVPLQIEDITLKPVAPDQVRVRIAASGVCHSDLSLAIGGLPFVTPSVLGHEGAGVVEQAGAGVSHVQPGDHVVIAWTAACHRCWYCHHGEPHLCSRAIADVYSMPYATDSLGRDLFPTMGVSSFATATNCLGRAVVKIDKSVPLDIAALIGCGVATGVGAAMNTAPVAAGSSVAVIGAGGVGLSAMLGAVVRGAGRVIVADPVAERRDVALALGATHAIDPAGENVVERIKALTGTRGADFVFEAVGRAAIVEQAVAATRRGGTTCIVGATGTEAKISLSTYDLFMDGKTLVGSQYGSTVPERDFPLLLDLWQSGRLPLDRLISDRITLTEVNKALDQFAAGTGLRTMIVNPD